MSYDRVVAECFLPDGRDLAAELVKAGLALDWPKFSGGKYRHLEPPDARRKLWRANLRQGGISPFDIPDDPRPIARPVSEGLAPARAIHVQGVAPPRHANYRLGWLAASGLLVLLASCQLIGGDAEQNAPANAAKEAAAFASFQVTAPALNIRRAPTASSDVLGQIGGGTIVTPQRMSGSWYGIVMEDGSMGWVHRDFLGPTDR